MLGNIEVCIHVQSTHTETMEIKPTPDLGKDLGREVLTVVLLASLKQPAQGCRPRATATLQLSTIHQTHLVEERRRVRNSEACVDQNVRELLNKLPPLRSDRMLLSFMFDVFNISPKNAFR